MATIITIDAGDTISSSRADINTSLQNLNTDKIETSVIDTDTTMAANSDAKIPSQKAVKTYVDTQGGANASETVRGIVEEATAAEVSSRAETGGTGARLYVNPAKANGAIASITTTKTNSGTFAEETVLTATLPANFLASGRSVNIRILATTNNRASAGVSGSVTWRFKIGSTTIISGSSPDVNSNSTEYECVIRKTTTNNQIAALSAMHREAGASSVTSGTAAETESSALTITVTAQGSGGAYTAPVGYIELLY